MTTPVAEKIFKAKAEADVTAVTMKVRGLAADTTEITDDYIKVPRLWLSPTPATAQRRLKSVPSREGGLPKRRWGRSAERS